MATEPKKSLLQSAATASFWSVSFDVAAGVNIDESAGAEFSSKRSNVREAYIGSLPPLDGRWESWAREARSSPYPIVYTLKDIGRLFDPKYIGTTANAAELRTKRGLFYQAIQDYCNKNLTG